LPAKSNVNLRPEMLHFTPFKGILVLTISALTIISIPTVVSTLIPSAIKPFIGNVTISTISRLSSSFFSNIKLASVELSTTPKCKVLLSPGIVMPLLKIGKNVLSDILIPKSLFKIYVLSSLAIIFAPCATIQSGFLG